MTKIQNSKPVLVLETGDLPAGWESGGQLRNERITTQNSQFAIRNSKLPLYALCSMPYALLNLTSPDLVIDSKSFKLISLVLLSIQTYSLLGGSKHEHS